jgi:hypothetical protein
VPTGLAVDSGGNVWITGTTLSSFTPPDGTTPYQAALKLLSDVFVAKLRMESSGPPTLLYWTYLGGSFEDRGGLIQVDASGKVYLTGSTFSSDFPVSSNALISTQGGDLDGFAVKLDPDAEGTASLLYGTFLGGSGYDVTTALSVDASGRMLVAGYSNSPQLNGTSSDAVQFPNQGGYETMVYQLDPAAAAGGGTAIFGTFLGGGGTDIATGVASDASGAIYLSGYTMSSNFPIAGDSYQGALNSKSNLFVVKFDPSLSGLDRLVYGTYLGGSGVDVATNMLMDQSGGIWLTGYTTSADFPVTSGAYQPKFGGGIANAFLARLDPSLPAGRALTYSTYFGGSGTEVAYGLALVGGKVALAGYTESDNLPVKGALLAGQARDVGADAFVALLDPSIAGPNALVYSTYFGGNSATDVASRIAVSPTGSIFVSGYTGSSDLPVTDGSSRGTPSGSTTGFLLRLDPLPGELSTVRANLRIGDNTALGVVTPRRTLLGVEPQPRRQSR